MEERIIDDEYGRGIRLKKTENGYVDVTDELAEGGEFDDSEGEVYDEVAFEFPELEEDDEELATLSPEEAMAYRKRKEEEEAARVEEYTRLCEEGNALLETGSFHAAELKFEKALRLDEEARAASVGYWRAKTSNFTEPDELMKEYVEIGYENLEGDLGYKAVEELKSKYQPVFERRLAELEEEEKPLAQEVETKQAKRRDIIGKRLTKAAWRFTCALVPTFLVLSLTLFFGSRIFSTKHGEFIMPTIISATIFAVGLIVTLVFTNKLLNTVRINRANEDLSSTEEGRTLLEIRNYIELYKAFTVNPIEMEEESLQETEEE